MGESSIIQLRNSRFRCSSYPRNNHSNQTYGHIVVRLYSFFFISWRRRLLWPMALSIMSTCRHKALTLLQVYRPLLIIQLTKHARLRIGPFLINANKLIMIVKWNPGTQVTVSGWGLTAVSKFHSSPIISVYFRCTNFETDNWFVILIGRRQQRFRPT